MKRRKATTVAPMRKQTSPRISTLAANLMRMATDAHLIGFTHVAVPVNELRSVAGSLISQDEFRGQHPKGKR